MSDLAEGLAGDWLTDHRPHATAPLLPLLNGGVSVATAYFSRKCRDLYFEVKFFILKTWEGFTKACELANLN